jgi:hypothetical protein
MSGVSNHYDTMTSIKSVIDGIGLSGLGACVIQEVAEYQDSQQTLPFVSISPYGPEKLGDELNDRDGVGYGVMVAIIAKKDATVLETRLGWRQSMRRRLNNASLAGLPTNYQLKVEPGSVVELAAYFGRKAFVSAFVVRATFQEART